MEPILRCDGLLKEYNGRPVVDGLSFQIGAGRIVGLLGPNGSGKTTMIKMINGILKPTSGAVYVNGMLPGPGTKSLVSYLPDRDFLSDDMTFHSSVAMYRDFFTDFDEMRATELMQRLGLDPNQRFKTMSKGTKEKVQLILAMSRRAKLYVLDEPIGGVDPAARDYILQTIVGNYAKDASVIIATHLITDVESVLDDVLFLKEGRIVLYNSAEQIREEYGKSINEVFKEVFACSEN